MRILRVDGVHDYQELHNQAQFEPPKAFTENLHAGVNFLELSLYDFASRPNKLRTSVVYDTKQFRIVKSG